MRALITGAGGGIGAACALAFAQAGAHLVLSDLRAPEDIVDAARDAGAASTLAHACNIADADAIAPLFMKTEAHLGRLDVAVHCAGIIHEAPLLETSIDDFDRVISINLRGSFLFGQAAVRLMQKQSETPSRLILVASDMAYYGRETFSPYVASKHGPLGADNMSDEWRAKELAIPLARFGTPAEVASLALYLAGDGGRFFTGQGLGINGGSIMA